MLAYLALLDRLDLSGVVVVGNSLGGWIAAELALRQSPRIDAVVLLNAVGIPSDGPGTEILDPATLSPAERGAAAFHDPGKFAIVPAGPDGVAALVENQRTLRVYAGEPFMHDPTLRARLSGVRIPTLVAWGESDRIAPVAYGRLFADSIPNARFELIAEAGHFPHIERLDAVVGLISDFAGAE